MDAATPFIGTEDFDLLGDGVNQSLGIEGPADREKTDPIYEELLPYPITFKEWSASGTLRVPDKFWSDGHVPEDALFFQNLTLIAYRVALFRIRQRMTPEQVLARRPWKVLEIPAEGGCVVLPIDICLEVTVEVLYPATDAYSTVYTSTDTAAQVVRLPKGKGILNFTIKDGAPALEKALAIEPDDGVVRINNKQTVADILVHIGAQGHELHAPIKARGGVDTIVEVRYLPAFNAVVFDQRQTGKVFVGTKGCLMYPGQALILSGPAEGTRDGLQQNVVTAVKYITLGEQTAAPLGDDSLGGPDYGSSYGVGYAGY